MKSFFAFIFLTATTLCAFGQEPKTLYFHVEKSSIKEKSILDSNHFFLNKKNASQQFSLLGYTGLFIKDSVVKSSSIHYYFGYTKHFNRIVLTSISDSSKHPKPIKSKNFENTLRNINKEIGLLENAGYPFASIKILNQREEDETIFMDYKIDSGNFFVIDEIYIKSESNIHDKTIMNLINIRPGEAYNEQKILSIQEILVSSKLYKLRRPPQIIFKNSKVDIYLFIEKDKSSSADGYVGFQQDQTSQKIVLNGYVNLQLYNSLNRAETIDLNWKSNPNKTQNLRLILEYPFIFNSPIGLGSSINLQKQDTTFIKSDLNFHISYIHPRFIFSLFDQIEGSSIISGGIPPVGFRNYKKNTIGISTVLKPKMPAYLNFYHPSIELMGGFFNYRSDTIDNNKQKISNNKYEIKYSHSIDFLKYFHLNNSLKFSGLSASIDLSRNELIYFGGLKSVRGFYELELFGNNIWILNTEVEFKPINLLSFIVLHDYSVFDYQGHHYTHSFGFGFGLINKASRLEIIIANGVLDDNPLDIKNTKVHIGFKSSF